jgi:signal recognition particle receptor subunit beta
MQELERLLNPGNGIRGELFFPTRRIDGYTPLPILAFKGTGGFVAGAPGTIKDSLRPDVLEDVQHAFGSLSSYLAHIGLVVRKLAQLPGDFEFLLVGHSLGGKLAAAVSRLTGKPALTFNSAGLNETLLTRTVPTSYICNCVVDGDLLTSLQDEIEKMRPGDDFAKLMDGLSAILQIGKSALDCASAMWITLEITEEYDLLLFMINQLEDHAVAIPVTAKDSEIIIPPRVDDDDGGFLPAETGKWSVRGLVPLVKCLAKLAPLGLQACEKLLGIPHTGLGLCEWLLQAFQGVPDTIKEIKAIDWAAIKTARKLHGTELICSSVRYKLHQQIQGTREALRQRSPGTPPASVFLIGSCAAGKSTMIAQMTQKVSKHPTTIGHEWASLQYQMQDGFLLSLRLCDSHRDSIIFLKGQLEAAAVIILVLDRSNPESDAYLKEVSWLFEDVPGKGICPKNKATRFMIALNKTDLPQQLATERVDDVAAKLRCQGRVFPIVAREGGDAFSQFTKAVADHALDWANHYMG